MATGYKLMDSFRSQIKKSKVNGINSRAEFDVGYPTGFLSLDYLNGAVIHVDTPEIHTSYNSIGIIDGSANTFIGRSGCGKSTFVIQAAANIVRPFDPDKAMIFIDDIEGSLPQYRKEVLLGFSQEEFAKRVEIRNTDITTENVFQRIKAIHDLKLEHKEDFEYDTGLYDTDGERIFKLIPTVYIIDSLPMLMPEDIQQDDAEITGGMGAAGIAKSNTELIKKISQLLKAANIILFTINHIMDDIQVNAYAPKQAAISGLKQGERLPGGRTALYLANNMFRLDDSKTLKATEGFGIDGSVVTATVVKSRTNRTRRGVPLIFNKSEGMFDDILSLYQLLKDEGKIGGAGSYMYIQGLPEIKFSQKDLKNKLAESPELQQAFANACNDILQGFLSDMRAVRYEEGEKKIDINSLILGLS